MARRKQHETVSSQGLDISSSSSPVLQQSCANHLVSNQWEKCPESRLLVGEHESAHQEETSHLCRRSDPQDCSVTCVGTDTRFPLSPVKLKESCGMMGMSLALSHPEQSPPIQGIQVGRSFPTFFTPQAGQSTAVLLGSPAVAQ